MTKNTPETVNFFDQRDLILAKVAEHGDLADMSAWRKAFPDIEFYDVDEGFSGEKIKWDSYSPMEKAAYVAYMENPQNAKLSFEVFSMEFDTIDGLIYEAVSSSETLWWLWFYHAFKYLGESGDFIDGDLFEMLLHIVERNMDQDGVDIDDFDTFMMDMTVLSFFHQKVI